MSRYANVLSGAVNNIVEWDGVSQYGSPNGTSPDGGTLVLSATAQIGYTYSGGVFTYGPPPVSPAILPTVLVGAPNTRTFAANTAYQATDPSKAAAVTLNFTSSATLSLANGTTNTAQVKVGPTNAVATTGTPLQAYIDGLTGSLVVGLNIASGAGQTHKLILPAGWWFAVVTGTGSVTMLTGYDQALG